MAEFQNFDIAGNFLRSYDAGRQRAKTDKFNALSGAAIAAPANQRDALIQQAVATDAESGFALAKNLEADTDKRQKTLYNMARGFDAVHKQNPQAAAVFYQTQIAPGLKRLGFEVSDQYDEAEVLPVVQQVLAAFDPTLASGLPAGVREKQFIAREAGLKPGDPDYQRVFRIDAGLDPRAVTAAPKQLEVKGSDGRTRQGIFDPSTSSIRVFDEASQTFRPLAMGESVTESAASPAQAGTGAATTRVDIDGIPADVQQRIATTAAQLAQAGIAEDQINAFVDFQVQQATGQPVSAPATTPAPRPVAPAGFGVSRTPEQEAGAITAAQEQAKTDALGQRGQVEATNAAAKASAETIAKGDAEKVLALRSELPNLQSTRSALQDALTGFRNGTYTSGPLVGAIPTPFQSPENQYLLTTINDSILATAERMKGTLSDKDVAFLKSATFNLNNKPEANIQILQRKLAIIDDAIARARGAQPSPAAADRAPSNVIRYDARGNRIP